MFLLREDIQLRTATNKGSADNAIPKGESSGDNATKETLDIVLECLDDAKAEDTITINIPEKSSLGDYMVVTSGRSNRHVSAICDQLLKCLKDHSHGSARVEGLAAGDWVLIDCGDIILHVFRPDVREFYNIEKMWQAPEVQEQTVH